MVSDAAAYLIFDDTVINKKYGDNVELRHCKVYTNDETKELIDKLLLETN
ncbi:MAG: hypothetical protein O4753_09745 [Trichodesmium sp. St7_bin2_1]|nr:hypothetical protein [Trichodesmium sp. St7_bin2_1]